MKKFFKLLILCSISTSTSAQICLQEYEEWQDLLKSVEGWSEASATAGAIGMGAGSFFGPVGGLAGIATGGLVGLGAWYQDSQAEKAEKRYRKCIENHKRKTEEKKDKREREEAKEKIMQQKNESFEIELERKKQAEEIMKQDLAKRQQELAHKNQVQDIDEIKF